ncbi:MAG: transporter, partial [Anaerolineae bacterium]|nr:transporter [Anaerolineae bacterium]
MNRTHARAAILVCIAFLFVVATTYAQRDYTPTFESTPCPFPLPDGLTEGEDVECGYLLVPENRANPAERTIRLAIGIFHPSGGAAYPDPIVYLS